MRGQILGQALSEIDVRRLAGPATDATNTIVPARLEIIPGPST
jgi:hypothetical protein